MDPNLQKAILLGNKLARAIGHSPEVGASGQCPKLSRAVPCTCGAGMQQAMALDDWTHFVSEMSLTIPPDRIKIST